MVTGPQYPLHAVLDLTPARWSASRVEYATSVAITVPGLPVARTSGSGSPDRTSLAAAVALAADSDVAVVLAGRLSGEAMDVESLALPGRQQAVVTAVAAANPRTVLVTLGAGPVVCPSQLAPADCCMPGSPGSSSRPALADVLTGRREPGGRLPITFPGRRAEHTDSRTASQYPGIDGVTTYSEGLLVGYRWYDERGVDPAFPFGHGMGYTTFEIDGLEVETTGDGCRGAARTAATPGSRAGKAVPQIYVRYPPGTGEPGAQLKGFDAVRLEPGERRELDHRHHVRRPEDLRRGLWQQDPAGGRVRVPCWVLLP